MSSERIKELLLKLKALSEQGNGGEKENATEMLNKALKKHGLTLEDLEKEEKQVRVFKIKDRGDSSVILAQCIWDVVHDADVKQSTKKLEVYCELSASDYVEVSEKYKHYYNIWLKEKKEFLTAYILRNKIGLSEEPSGESKLTEEEQLSIVKKMNSIDDNKFVNKNLKQLN
jgi:Mg2+ and Co2+ transporter CorA